jgi:uncharacterized repeat protein (TIGR01451 family)
MKKLILSLTLAAVLLLVKPGASLADCNQIYGGGETCTTTNTFSIQKLVKKPGKGGGQFVNNMSINDPRYSPAQTVSFQIIVKNTGNQTIPNITVVDTFPQFVSFVSGPGNYNAANKTLTFNVVNLNAGQIVKYTVTGKIADSNIMPADQGIVCLINQATGTDNNGMANSTSSQFCVEKQVLGTNTPQVLPMPKVTKTPSTGPEMLPLLALFPGALGGLILRRKTKKTS